MKWPKTYIKTKEGRKEAVAPIVISASRRTDIPAFYPECLIHQLQSGWTKWINPYSGSAQYISFENSRAFVFWTKNPRPLMPWLKVLDEMSIGYYFQFTLNDYCPEGLEPGLPPLTDRIKTFQELSDLIGAQRVIWRFDPLILAQGLEPDTLLKRIGRLADCLQGYTRKLVFSFAEITGYAKVRRNLKSYGVNWRNFSQKEMLELAAKLSSLASRRGMEIAACAQEVDLSPSGVRRNSCIDPDLLEIVSGQRKSSIPDFKWNSYSNSSIDLSIPRGKDPGQRKYCGCSPAKDIGQYNTCSHGCLYCYANTSPGIILADQPA